MREILNVGPTEGMMTDPSYGYLVGDEVVLANDFSRREM